MAAALVVAGIVAVRPQASAQTGVLSPGDALTSAFSGLRTGSGGTPLPDPDGVTVRAFGMGDPGYRADGSIWQGGPVIFSHTARQTGQVFGMAFDDEAPANAYLAASSAFGLYPAPTGEGWADGMWGEGGGPGTVWRLDAAANYRPVPFAQIATEGRPNSGPGLGGLTFDPWNRQLFVADLESGLIHRIDLETGESIQTFDHGLDGRSYFLDVTSGQYLVLDVVPDANGSPRFDDCTDAEGAAAPFVSTPDCWNYADFRRRVWGLGVQRDPVTDTVRLYYAVWGGAALGSNGWDTAGDDARTSIWSVRLDGNGGFDLTDVRREFIVPPLLIEQEGAGQGETPAVTEIVFSSDGAMLLAERGRPAPDFTTSPPQLVAPRSGRVLLFIRNQDGVWESNGRYDVGFPERGADFEPPHIRANATGGVSLGPGYTEAGATDPAAVDATVWMSADPLCASDGPCIDRQTGQSTVSGPLGGVQGTPISATTDLAPPDAAQPPPTAGEPVTPPAGPLASYLLVAPGTAAAIGGMGGIGVYRAEPPTQIVEAVAPDEESPPELPAEAQAVEAPLPDLAVAKTGLGRCVPGGECSYQISVTNRGPVEYSGPVMLTDTIGSPGVSLVAATPEEWLCSAVDGNIYCLHAPTTLAPGASLSFALTLRPSTNHREPRLNNCVAVTWLGLQGRDRIRAVQAELKLRGYDPGTVDGIMGPRTATAIRQAQSAASLPATGEIDAAFVEALFGPGANQDGDASPANDQDCGLVQVDVPAPAGHLVQVSGFHRRFDSVNHDPVTSAPFSYHDLDLSYFHRTWRSSLHDAVISQPIPLHQIAVSQFHLTWGSGYHDGIYTRLIPVHTIGLSGFHSANRSVYHDWRTSGPRPIHSVLVSGFHRSWTSSRHDGIITRVMPLHWAQQSAFHRRFESGLHDRTVTGMRPIHNPSVSNFHNFNESRLHDPLTTRFRPIHQTGPSGFHRTGASGFHNSNTSGPRPGHIDNISVLHRSFTSSQHEPFTTRMRPVHATGLSNFHRNSSSLMHNPRTTQPTDIHLTTMSNFHRNNPSSAHNPTTTQRQAVHQQTVSNFHQSGASRLHDASSSRAAPVHAPTISTFHRTNRSGQHVLETSYASSPSHQLGLSNYHRSAPSAQHNNRLSQGVSPAHQPAVSSFHRNRTSDQHESRTSRGAGQQPVEPGIPGMPSHSAAASRSAPGTPPAHDATASRATPGIPPTHNAAISRVQRPQAPAHDPSVSRLGDRPAAPQPPVRQPGIPQPGIPQPGIPQPVQPPSRQPSVQPGIPQPQPGIPQPVRPPAGGREPAPQPTVPRQPGAQPPGTPPPATQRPAVPPRQPATQEPTVPRQPATPPAGREPTPQPTVPRQPGAQPPGTPPATQRPAVPPRQPATQQPTVPRQPATPPAGREPAPQPTVPRQPGAQPPGTPPPATQRPAAPPRQPATQQPTVPRQPSAQPPATQRPAAPPRQPATQQPTVPRQPTAPAHSANASRQQQQQQQQQLQRQQQQQQLQRQQQQLQQQQQQLRQQQQQQQQRQQQQRQQPQRQPPATQPPAAQAPATQQPAARPRHDANASRLQQMQQQQQQQQGRQDRGGMGR